MKHLLIIALLLLSFAAKAQQADTLYHCFLVVNQAFKTAYEGTKIDASVLKTATTVDGRIVVSLNAVDQFPKVFRGIGQTTFSIAWLKREDFPISELPK